MDPAGILMLRSVRIVFEMLGLQPESIKFKKEEFNSDNLIKALTANPKKCPAIVTCNVLRPSLHVMVATNALQGKDFPFGNFSRWIMQREKWFINCKNSYRNDISEPGNF